MKILIAGTLTNRMNGSARSFARLACFLSERHEVHALLPDEGGIAQDLAAPIRTIIEPAVVPVRRSARNLLTVPAGLARMDGVLRRLRPDLVIINDIPWFHLLGPAKLRGARVAIFVRFFEPNGAAGTVIRAIVRRSDAVVYVSEFIRRLWGFDDNTERHVTLHNPGVFDLRLREFDGLPKRYLLIVSRIDEAKGILEGLRVFAALAGERPDVALIVAGAPLYRHQERYRERCVDFVSRAGLADRVVWLGEVRQPHSLYRDAVAFLHFPNFEDPFPTTIMEALAFGSRIVTRAKGGIPEQVAGFRNALVIDPDAFDPAEVLAFLEREKSDDSELYARRFGEPAYKEKLGRIVDGLSPR